MDCRLLVHQIKFVFKILTKKGIIRLKRIKLYLEELYEGSPLQKGEFFLRFLSHHYDTRQFDLRQVRHNFHVLARLQEENGLDADQKGRLKLLLTSREKWFFKIKNSLLLGAFQSRVEKSVQYTFTTLTLEIYNPFNRSVLKRFLQKKIALLEGLLKKVHSINGKKWKSENISINIDLFQRNSLLQEKIIRKMEQALRRQRPVAIIQDAQEALKKGLVPLLVSSGVSGSYWMRSTKKEIAGLFKPFDEEPHAPNNPLGPRMQGALGHRRTRVGSRVGESVHHEVGAFIVDQFLGLGIVPKTYYASFTHQTFFYALEDRLARRAFKKKMGSFQEFISGFAPFSKLDREEYAKIPLEEFQLLVVLDVIIGSTDRNGGNFLVGEDKIAAIDHGFCFPDTHIDDLSYWYWGYLEQGNHPLFPGLMDLMNNFPFEALSWKLKKRCFISMGSLHRMRERVALFAAGCRAGLVPAQMSALMVEDYLMPLNELEATLKEQAELKVSQFLTKGQG